MRASQTPWVRGFSQYTCLFNFRAGSVANACVCSGVATTTASKDFSSSKTLRRSWYFFAVGCSFPAASRRRSSTSQSATMFSLETFFRSEAPWPPQPIEAMLRRALGDFSWP